MSSLPGLTRPSDSPLVRAARREAVPHTPVWFMRQAGRSLPEYRKVREGIAMLDACRDPGPGHRDHPAAGPPPRRRRGDLLQRHRRPARGGRGRPRHRARRRSGRRRADPHPRRPRPAARADARARPGHHRGGAAAGRASSAARRSSGSPARRSPSRPTSSRVAPPQPRAHQGADVRRPRSCGTTCAPGSRRSPARSCGCRPRPARRAVQLFDSWVGALPRADYEAYVQPHSAAALAAVADLDVPRIHFGVGTGELLASMGAAGAEVVGVDYRVSLTDGVAPPRARLRRAGQPRPGPAVRAVGRRSRPRCAPSSTRAARRRATSSTSVTACCRTPTPTC